MVTSRRLLAGLGRFYVLGFRVCGWSFGCIIWAFQGQAFLILFGAILMCCVVGTSLMI